MEESGADGYYRGAVRPPFIEALQHSSSSTPAAPYRGAVRPPFIEAVGKVKQRSVNLPIGGQSAPPSLKPLSSAIS